jgi:hypothetical protein
MTVDDYRVKAFMGNAQLIYKALGPTKDKRCETYAKEHSDGLWFEVFLRNEKDILAMANDCEKFSKNWEIRQCGSHNKTKYTVFIIDESDLSVQRNGEWAYNKQIRRFDSVKKFVNGELIVLRDTFSSVL